MVRSRWSLDFVENFTVFEVKICPEAISQFRLEEDSPGAQGRSWYYRQQQDPALPGGAMGQRKNGNFFSDNYLETPSHPDKQCLIQRDSCILR